MFFLSMPMVYRLAAIAAIVLALFGFGYYKGHSNMKEKFDAYKAEVTAIGKAQEVKAKSIEKQADGISKGISNAYNRDVAAVRSYYDRVRQQSGGCQMSAVPNSSSGVNERAADELFGQCAEATLQLIYLQQWVREQEQNFNQINN